ncbi:MAG TPA: hypothetical protein VD971_11880 [Phycisphaerales bacterium]|nr:hypothetical protein [Phycisphaerales bacterium]
MFWKRLLDRTALGTPGAAARHAHSQWLTEAFASDRDYPRIPVRRVADGGFSALMSRENGPAHAERWWSLALERMD